MSDEEEQLWKVEHAGASRHEEPEQVWAVSGADAVDQCVRALWARGRASDHEMWLDAWAGSYDLRERFFVRIESGPVFRVVSQGRQGSP